MPSPGELMWGVLFGSIGVGYMIYGRRQQKSVVFYCGLGLMVVPYIIDSTVGVVLTSVALMSGPWLVRL